MEVPRQVFFLPERASGRFSFQLLNIAFAFAFKNVIFVITSTQPDPLICFSSAVSAQIARENYVHCFRIISVTPFRILKPEVRIIISSNLQNSVPTFPGCQIYTMPQEIICYRKRGLQIKTKKIYLCKGQNDIGFESNVKITNCSYNIIFNYLLYIYNPL